MTFLQTLIKKMFPIKNETLTPTFNCKKCGDEIYVLDFHKKAESCTRKKCFLRRAKAREYLARLTDKHPDDFIPVCVGQMKLHQEEEVKLYENINLRCIMDYSIECPGNTGTYACCRDRDL